MSGAANGRQPSAPPMVRCAIYTRKSSEEGLEQEFNSLMAQREAAEAYILSQREQGWRALAEPYDDGGFSGGNMDRPALKRLLADVQARRIDCVVVYKVDRLSRSLLDFASIMGTLDKHNVSFVSVTQQFNTTTSLGRLTLNILLSFAQFEREIISERTRDKVFAARRKGKWTGGYPVLGYDVAAAGGKLNVNEQEAKQVRAIFQIFARKGTLVETLYEIDRRGWKTKSWVTRRGTTHLGKPFTRHTLEYLLWNPIYLGKVRLKGELHAGEQAAIVDSKLWRKVNRLLKAHQMARESQPRQPQNALLRGLLFCEPCGTPMVPTYTKRNGRRIRYYTCLAAQKRGWKTCPSRALPAQLIEAAVVEKLDPESAQLESRIDKVTYHGGTRQTVITLREAHEHPIVFTLSLRKPRGVRKRRPAGRTPRITRLMALAIRFEELLRGGGVEDYADLARLGRVTRARITQIMNLLNLAPDIQEALLFLTPVHTWRDALTERTCRPVIQEPCWQRQREIFTTLFSRHGVKIAAPQPAPE